jgi:hypothetical protein
MTPRVNPPCWSAREEGDSGEKDDTVVVFAEAEIEGAGASPSTRGGDDNGCAVKCTDHMCRLTKLEVSGEP